MMQTQEFKDQNWGHCLLIKNDRVELTLPFELGPRIFRYAFIGEKSLFAEFPAQKTDLAKGKWHSYGGHRLWHGPEDIVRTYIPDNEPVRIELRPTSVLIQQNIETRTQLQKEMEVCLGSTGTHVQVTHRIRNHSLFDVRLALWAITVMTTGGQAILPFPPRGSHADNLQAQTSLNLWAYTNLLDPRWQLGEKLITLQQDPANTEAQKIGISRSDGWLAYLKEGQAFINQCHFRENQSYPDEGSSSELYVDHKSLEMESLSPLITIKSGDFAELVEDWYLIKGINLNAKEEELYPILSSPTV